MKKGLYVRIIPLVSTANAVPGFTDKKPKPPPPYLTGHWLEGFLAEDIALTGQICFDRHLRNGKEVGGSWRSSPICIVKGDQIFCQRAIYRIMKVPAFDPERSLQAWDEYGETS
jgi:hypothetical protein